MKANYFAYMNGRVIERAGPSYITRIISQYELRGAHKQRNMYLPCSFVYPFAIFERRDYLNRPEKIFNLFPETMGIHYWANSWTKPKKTPAPTYLPSQTDLQGYPLDDPYAKHCPLNDPYGERHPLDDSYTHSYLLDQADIQSYLFD